MHFNKKIYKSIVKCRKKNKKISNFTRCVVYFVYFDWTLGDVSRRFENKEHDVQVRPTAEETTEAADEVVQNSVGVE